MYVVDKEIVKLVNYQKGFQIGHLEIKLVFLSPIRLLSSAVEQLIRNEQVVGSNPMGGSGRHGFGCECECECDN